MLWNLLSFFSPPFSSRSQSAIFNVLIKNLVSDKLYCLWCDEYSDLSQSHATSWKLASSEKKTPSHARERRRQRNRAIGRANGFVDVFVLTVGLKRNLKNRFVMRSREQWCEHRWKWPTIICSPSFSVVPRQFYAHEKHNKVGNYLI